MHFISKQVLPGIHDQKQRRIRDPRMEKPLYRLFRCKIRQSQILWKKNTCVVVDLKFIGKGGVTPFFTFAFIFLNFVLFSFSC